MPLRKLEGRLRYEEAPDYDHIRDLLRELAAAVGPEALPEPLDWMRRS